MFAGYELPNGSRTGLKEILEKDSTKFGPTMPEVIRKFFGKDAPIDNKDLFLGTSSAIYAGEDRKGIPTLKFVHKREHYLTENIKEISYNSQLQNMNFAKKIGWQNSAIVPNEVFKEMKGDEEIPIYDLKGKGMLLEAMLGKEESQLYRNAMGEDIDLINTHNFEYTFGQARAWFISKGGRTLGGKIILENPVGFSYKNDDNSTTKSELKQYVLFKK